MAVIAETPTPVKRRVMNRSVVPCTAAFKREKPEYQTVVMIRPFFRPTRSENQPPVTAPKNMPINVAETIKLIVEIERFQAFIIAGAANEKVLTSATSTK